MEKKIYCGTELDEILSKITFKNTVLDFKWAFEHSELIKIGERNGWLVWVTFERPDTVTGDVGRGRGRDEIIWQKSTESSVVKTAWVLVELMVRHELMEGFRYKDCRIFNPHNTVGALVE